MGPGILPETTVGKHNPPCYLQMPTKALSCKKEAICEHGPEAPSCPVGQGSFKINSCWKSSSAKGGRPSSVSSAFSSKAASLMVWGCICAYGMGSLHVWEGTMNAGKVYKGFRVTYAPLQTTCISAGQCKTTYCSYYNSMAS